MKVQKEGTQGKTLGGKGGILHRLQQWWRGRTIVVEWERMNTCVREYSKVGVSELLWRPVWRICLTG